VGAGLGGKSFGLSLGLRCWGLEFPLNPRPSVLCLPLAWCVSYTRTGHLPARPIDRRRGSLQRTVSTGDAALNVFYDQTSFTQAELEFSAVENECRIRYRGPPFFRTARLAARERERERGERETTGYEPLYRFYWSFCPQCVL